MKKIIISISLVIATMLCSTSCSDYLDIVPEGTPSMDNAFSNRINSFKFLHTCYSYLPSWDQGGSIGFLAGDEHWLMPKGTGFIDQRISLNAWEIGRGEQNNNDPYQNFWDGGNGGTNLWVAIRDCNIFLENINKPLDLQNYERTRWIAEVKFLKAYYHYYLFMLYGPIPIMDTNIAVDASQDEVRRYREPVDDVVAYISNLLDEAYKDLPSKITDPGQEMGRITQPIAKAVKARLLLYAASDLWNGKFPYPDWKNKNFETPGYGKELVSQVYDPDKWERALTACKDALEWAEGEGGCGLMTTKESAILMGNQGLNLGELDVPVDGVTEEFKKHVYLMRYLVTSRYSDGNREMIWGLADDGGVVMASLPVHVVKVDGGPWRSGYSGYSPLLNSVERFYTKEGELPRIAANKGTFAEEDSWYESAGRSNADIIKLNTNREPRFYAWLSFDGDQYSPRISGGKPLVLNLKKGEAQGWNRTEFARDHCVTGYMSKKFIQPDLNWGTNWSNNEKSYPRPLFRLAELYLSVAECLAALDRPKEALTYLNVVRERAGIPDVTEEMLNDMPAMDWIRNERFVELWGEGLRYYDARRWMIAAGVRKGLNMEQVEEPTFEELNQPVIVNQDYKWENRMYLAPIFANETYKNPQMVQAPEY